MLLVAAHLLMPNPLPPRKPPISPTMSLLLSPAPFNCRQSLWAGVCIPVRQLCKASFCLFLSLFSSDQERALIRLLASNQALLCSARQLVSTTQDAYYVSETNPYLHTVLLCRGVESPAPRQLEQLLQRCDERGPLQGLQFSWRGVANKLNQVKVSNVEQILMQRQATEHECCSIWIITLLTQSFLMR